MADFLWTVRLWLGLSVMVTAIVLLVCVCILAVKMVIDFIKGE